MFKWNYEFHRVVHIPIKKVWEFNENPSNWHKWLEILDPSYHPEGEVKTGSTIKAKMKGKNAYLHFFVSELKSYSKAKVTVTTIFHKQESSSTFKEISPEKTDITINFSIRGFLIPILKRHLNKYAEDLFAKYLRAILNEASIET